MPDAGSRMNIVVTVKHVPDPVAVAGRLALGAGGDLATAQFPHLANGYDLNALEAALRLKAAHGGRVTAITVGSAEAVPMLRRVLAMGADAVVLIDAARVGGATAAVAAAIAAQVAALGSVDLVLAGRQSSDAGGGLVLFGIAAALGIAAVSPVSVVEGIEGGRLVVHRIDDAGFQRVAVRLPAVIGVSSEANEPRYPSPKGLVMATRTKIAPVAPLPGATLPPTATTQRVYVVESPTRRAELLAAATPEEAGIALADRLRTEGFVR